MPRALKQLAKFVTGRYLDLRRTHHPRRQEPTQRLAAFEQGLRLGTVQRRTVKRRLRHFFIADRHAKALAKLAQLLFVHLLLLVADVAALTGFAEAVSLDGLRENHRRRALVLHRRLERCVNLLWIVAAAYELVNLVV